MNRKMFSFIGMPLIFLAILESMLGYVIIPNIPIFIIEGLGFLCIGLSNSRKEKLRNYIILAIIMFVVATVLDPFISLSGIESFEMSIAINGTVASMFFFGLSLGKAYDYRRKKLEG